MEFERQALQADLSQHEVESRIEALQLRKAAAPRKDLPDISAELGELHRQLALLQGRHVDE